MTDRVPPHNPIAEEHLLGALLQSQAVRELVLPELSGGDFYLPRCRAVYFAVADLYDQGEPITDATVSNVLRHEGVFQHIGGATTLNRLKSEAIVGSTAAQKYARIIREDASLRNIIALCSSMAEAAYACPDGGLEELLEVSIADLQAIDIPGAKLPEALTTVEEFMDRPKDQRPDWVIRGLLRQGWRVVLVAVEGFGKTTLLHQLALSAARGVHPFIDDIEIPVQTTLLVDCENPDDRLDEGFEFIMPTLDKLKPLVPGKAYLWRQPGGIDLRTRNDRAALEAVIAHVRPSMVCAGPTYKTFMPKPGEGYELPAREVMGVWDNLRTRYKFSLVLESHASKGSGGARQMVPEGTALWLRWSEFGLSFLRDEKLNGPDDNLYYKIDRFRLDRIRNHGWPSGIDRATTGLPWAARWKDNKWREYIRDDVASILPPEPPFSADELDYDEEDSPF